MLYVDYDRFMQDIQIELDINLPEYDFHSGYFDDKNFISCTRKDADQILIEIAIMNNKDYTSNDVSFKIPFEIYDKQTLLNYPIKNLQLMDGIKKFNDYLPAYHSIEIAEKINTNLLETYYTSYLVIASKLTITSDLSNNSSYILDDIFFDFQLNYRIHGSYKTVSASNIFKQVDDKLKSNYYSNPSDYENLSMVERVRLYNIAQKLSQWLKS